MQFETAIRASQGARRSQEDTALVWPAPAGGDAATLVPLLEAIDCVAAAVLCDGMGGHIGGAMASRLACEHFLPGLLAADGPVRNRLMVALAMADNAITGKVRTAPAYKGMGATLVGVHLATEGLWWVSVGDSLLYLWRKGELQILNADHSLAPEIDKLAESGKISWDEAANDPRRHYLRAALTGDEIEMIDLSEQPLPLEAGDVVILASDGIHTLEPGTMAALIAEFERSGAALIAMTLIAAVDAMRQPHQDNTTIVVIRVLDAALASGHRATGSR